MPAGDPFVRQVRDALENLHDLPHLQTHPLAARAGGSGPSGRALQRALEEVLGALGAGRIPELLRLRYAEALEPPEVWRRLGIGKSEYHRSHGRGVAAVAQLLAEHWGTAGAPGASAEPTAPGGAPGNLPAEPSSFVGRDREMAAVERLLSQTRLVTLIGPPGAGKTRLSLEVAARAGARLGCADGVWFVPLAPLTAPDAVLPAIGRRLGVHDDGERPLAERLPDHLRGRRLLLVLDNFEHLLGAAPAVVDLLRAAPGLRVLVTSRSALRVPGEHEYPVGGLAPNEAARLFAERARGVQPGFGPTDEDAAAVAAICRRLDGLPLAIELAAARSKVLAPGAILARLESRLALLSAGARAADDPAAARHRTLRAAIDWSHDLLDAEEQRVLRRLAVFAGGFMLAAAEAVVGEGALDGVGALLDRSLLQRGEAGGEPRFAMLETIREYALERLEAEPAEAAAARAAHAAFFLALAERARADAAGPEQPSWAVRLAAEEADLLAALGWYADRTAREAGAGGVPVGLRGEALTLFGVLRPVREAELLEPPPAAWADPRRWEEQARALALGTRPVSAAAFAVPAEALPALGERVAAARAAGDAAALAAGLRQTVFAHLTRGRIRAARRLCDEAAALVPRLDDRSAVAWVLHLTGVAAFADGDHAAARAAFDEELALARSWGSPLWVGRALEWFGNLALEQRDPLEAGARYEEALRAFRDAGDRVFTSQNLLGLGLVALERGDPPRARGLLGESLVLQQQTPARQGAVLTLEGLAGVSARTPAGAERALRLAGAASAARTRPGGWRVWPNSQVARDRLERWLGPARRALAPDAAAAAWAAGRATPLEEALARALDDERAPGR